jgi:hypothetical protein
MLKEETRALRKVYIYKTNKGMSQARKMWSLSADLICLRMCDECCDECRDECRDECCDSFTVVKWYVM